MESEIYAKHNVVKIDVLAIGPETSGWFKFEVKELEQLRGLKMRFFGLGARVMQKLGVSTQLLAGGDIFPALEKGVIDATEFSMPAMDIKYGFYQIAKNNYFPGWHQQVSVSHILINKDKWDALPDQYKAMIEMTAGESVHYIYAETEYVNPYAMLEMGEKYGVITRRWRDDQIAVFEKAWLEVLEEDSAKDPLFKKVADSYLGFRKTYAKWGEAQALKPTYLGIATTAAAVDTRVEDLSKQVASLESELSTARDQFGGVEESISSLETQRIVLAVLFVLSLIGLGFFAMRGKSA